MGYKQKKNVILPSLRLNSYLYENMMQEFYKIREKTHPRLKLSEFRAWLYASSIKMLREGRIVF